MGIEPREDWDSVVAEWTASRRFALWRRHSDAVNTALLQRWLPRAGAGSLLKTDLFDEAVSEGLYPALSGTAGRVTGIDVSAGAAAASGRRHAGLATLAADVRRLPFADASFDRVVSIRPSIISSRKRTSAAPWRS